MTNIVTLVRDCQVYLAMSVVVTFAVFMGTDGAGWARTEQVGHGWSRLDTDGAGWTRTEPVGHGRSRLDTDGAGPYGGCRWTRTEGLDTDGAGWTRTEGLDTDGAGWTRAEGWGAGQSRSPRDG